VLAIGNQFDSLSARADAVQTRYLVDLALPAPGTVCGQDHVPFTG
jgi:hypothetical protein